MSPSPPTVSSEEKEQVLQTIEMFEVIVQANPQDCQSMEILKDAYSRVGMKTEMLVIARKLAATYAELTQFSAAMLEYEGILKHDPDNPEIMAALGEVEERMTRATKASAGSHEEPTIALNFSAVVTDSGTLMTTASTQRPNGFRVGSVSAARAEEVAALLSEDGNEALAKFLIANRLAPEDLVQQSLERVKKRNEALAPDQVGASLIDEIVRREGADIESLLVGIIERTKFAYIPLEYYEIDRQIVKMLPETITLNRLIVPFDVMSRTLMIATANPFDALGKQAVHQLLDYTVQWHLASPAAIFKALGEAYKVSGSRAASMAASAAASAAANSASASASQPAETIDDTAESGEPSDDDGPLPDTSAFRLRK